MAAALWGRGQLDWPETELDRSGVYLEREAAAAAVGAPASRDDADKAHNWGSANRIENASEIVFVYSRSF